MLVGTYEFGPVVDCYCLQCSVILWLMVSDVCIFFLLSALFIYLFFVFRCCISDFLFGFMVFKRKVLEEGI